MKGHLCTWGAQCPLFAAWHRTMNSRVCVYDNGGKTADRYSVLIKRTASGKKVVEIYGMSDDPLSPQGINQYSHTAANGFRDFAFLGKRVRVIDLPEDVRKAIEHRI